MKYNIDTKQLFTDQLKYLKTVVCPLNLEIKNLKKEEQHYHCSHCHKSIIDITHHTDQMLINLFDKNPDQCISININQVNISITRERK
ncbi:hypothetical protein MY04_05840 (plasmid) [Flammeovirga sp. MY04]|uniref:hypothetical protein n=1 Tax=Flammeovirga sp. MY04 TaxID=1191459 RepID=UPI0008060963|nr:hypothetical protein [Flammeovirga sp. MY04]ANQ52900.1 hypothetical protein MY04_05840 [Flammeovirga sp. MY04]